MSSDSNIKAFSATKPRKMKGCNSYMCTTWPLPRTVCGGLCLGFLHSFSSPRAQRLERHPWWVKSHHLRANAKWKGH